MRLAYFDCFSGISGDMALAALIHAGADLESIRGTLHGFPVGPFDIQVEEVDARGMMALRLEVQSEPQGVIRTFASIRQLLDEADLPEATRRVAHRAYRRLAEAAAIAHGKDPELVTFHEFGEVDSLVDIVGCAAALEMLGVERVFASPVPTGLGMARTEHGIMPIPSPVVLELLQGVPTYSRGIPVELVTPTGAAILAAVSEGYGDMPTMRADQIGYGAGLLRLDFPHVLRVVVGEEQRAGVPSRVAPAEMEVGEVRVEVVVDQPVPSSQDGMLERLIAAGASDAWLAPAVGRGGRARTVVTALATAESRDAVVRAMRECAGAGQGDSRVRVSPVTSPET